MTQFKYFLTLLYTCIQASKEADGSSKIAMASVDDCKKLLEKKPDANCLPTTPEWNYAVRLYVPEEEVYNGSYSFPDPVPLA